MRFVSPSVRETAFNCPHCGALAQQAWYSLHVRRNWNEHPLPLVFEEARRRKVGPGEIHDDAEKEAFIRWAQDLKSGQPFVHGILGGQHCPEHLHNAFLSECFNCKDISLWIGDNLAYPRRGEAPPANPDLPPNVRGDYNEASTILDLSPRGAAALLRLAIQKLCMALGQPGENLNQDIGALVEQGLDARVQQSLDAIRVIGNNAVHPGQIDLQDDRATAESLFGLLNLIAEKTISEPKHVAAIYDALPAGARQAIELRDTEN